jgi:hypothetical protein
MTAYRIGSNVDGFCTKCKLILAHTIEAVVDTTIKRVHCNTCKSKHAYRAHAPGEAPAKAKSAGKKATKSIKVGGTAGKKRGVPGLVRASDYSTLLKGRGMASARQYSFRDRFRTGEVLTHNLFGLGVVTADKGADKIEVLFELGPKTLIHGKVVS